MNPFGVSRRILLSILLCVASGLSAEQPKSLDLVYRSLDLRYSALGLEGGAQNVGGKGEGTAGASSALRSEVVDLKAAGAEIKESATEIKISLQGEILFDFDKSNLRPAAESTLAQVAKMIGVAKGSVEQGIVLSRVSAKSDSSVTSTASCCEPSMRFIMKRQS
jgi:outer membrane protein OmpA-like peptidoglycan-associated protein